MIYSHESEVLPSDALEIIESHWYKESKALRASKVVLRTVMDSDRRKAALEAQEQVYEHSNALLDAYLDIRADELFGVGEGALVEQEADNHE